MQSTFSNIDELILASHANYNKLPEIVIDRYMTFNVVDVDGVLSAKFDKDLIFPIDTVSSLTWSLVDDDGTYDIEIHTSYNEFTRGYFSRKLASRVYILATRLNWKIVGGHLERAYKKRVLSNVLDSSTTLLEFVTNRASILANMQEIFIDCTSEASLDEDKIVVYTLSRQLKLPYAFAGLCRSVQESDDDSYAISIWIDSNGYNTKDHPVVIITDRAGYVLLRANGL